MLRGERSQIAASFGFRESPARRIRALEEAAGRSRGGLRELYRRVGEGAAGEDSPLRSRLSGGDLDFLERAGRYETSAGEQSREIRRLESAIFLDEEKRVLAKLENALDGEKNRITAGEKNIDGLNRKIAEAQRRIGALREAAEAGPAGAETNNGGSR